MTSNIAKLQLLETGKLVQEFPLTKRELSIGREPDNDLVIDSPQVSRKHARLHFNGRNWVVENLSQSNPVQVVVGSDPQPLRNGDQFLVGSLVMRLVLANPVPPTTGPTPLPTTNPLEDRPTVTMAGQGPVVQDRPTRLTSDQAVMPRGTMMLSDENRDGVEDHGYGTMVMSSSDVTMIVEYEHTRHEFPLTADRITIGRAPESDIVIPLTTVSRLHAVLTRTPNGYLLTDQQSRNGLQYGGHLVREVKLKDGDVVRIGDQLGNYATLAYKDTAHPAPTSFFSLRLDPTVQQVTIGRDPGNTMVLNYPPVSAYHAVIKREPGGTATVQDLGSTNGTFVRGQRVRPNAPMRIGPGDAVQIASYQLIYQPDQLAQVDSEKVRIDAIGVTKTINNNTVMLLHDVTISIQPKEFVGIVGGSGTGKSTLMDSLNGFRPASFGKVLLNGEDYYQNFAAYRSSLGYVPQEDIIHRELTVEKALYYAAKLRLPKDTSRKEIEQRLAQVLDDVEMTKRRKVLVSKLSGGRSR